MRTVWLVLALAACQTREKASKDDPDIDEIGRPQGEGPSGDWSQSKTCAVQDAELVYVVDNTNRLLSFDPRKLPGNDPFHLVGTLKCTTTSTPNSMAVDRRGIAWIGYQNGKVYRASIIDARCDKKGWKPTGNATRVFGMGYVTKGPRTEEEILFVAGGVDDPTFQLATIDTEHKAWAEITTLAIHGHPELTGTSEGRLFAYYPTPGRGFVQELDRQKGSTLGPVWKIPGNVRNVEAYAFAHYGGVFYVFTTADGVSSVHAVHMKTGTVELVRTSLPYTIVGAGVSTCAPLLEEAPQ